LNLSVIAFETELPRGMIDGILTEVLQVRLVSLWNTVADHQINSSFNLQAFARGIICKKSLEFPFPFIGEPFVFLKI